MVTGCDLCEQLKMLLWTILTSWRLCLAVMAFQGSTCWC